MLPTLLPPLLSPVKPTKKLSPKIRSIKPVNGRETNPVVAEEVQMFGAAPFVFGNCALIPNS
ncbi:hypothetical protein HRbin37_01023 [bacterium HR37]|nr:hypothetical protein HRbin37_01023 [bacterium HR37]